MLCLYFVAYVAPTELGFFGIDGYKHDVPTALLHNNPFLRVRCVGLPRFFL